MCFRSSCLARPAGTIAGFPHGRGGGRGAVRRCRGTHCGLRRKGAACRAPPRHGLIRSHERERVHVWQARGHTHAHRRARAHAHRARTQAHTYARAHAHTHTHGAHFIFWRRTTRSTRSCWSWRASGWSGGTWPSRRSRSATASDEQSHRTPACHRRLSVTAQ